MRIACTNHHRQLVGGTESYLKRIIPELARLGHTVSLWHEGDVPSSAASIDAPEVFKVKADSSESLIVWRPDVVFNHGLMQMNWETSLASIAPVVHYAHNFYGTCISGEKTRKRPSPGACGRCFGPGCLMQYLPRGCGGLNPVRMWHDYQLQSQRLTNLRCAASVVTASRYMRDEYRKHGLNNVQCAPLYVERPSPPPAADPRRLLFCGRMTHLKGGNLLLDAIPEVERLLGRTVEVFFAGEGPQRQNWEARSAKATFTGWISQQALRNLNCGILVIPSIWPEPFGLAGLEMGVPVAAFPVGGIPDWLREGVNGHLAPSLTSAGLAEAIVSCMQNFQQLQQGALDVAAEFSLTRHLAVLIPILEAACQ